MKKLIAELNEMLTNHPEISELREMEQNERVRELLSEENRVVYDSLPDDVARQLALDRDEHGNVMVSQIESERLLSSMVAHVLDMRAEAGEIERIKFKTQHHFFGYEGRASFPSNFDADYCYSLGYNASHLIFVGATGYMSAITHLGRKAQDWVACGVPITMMMNMERRSGKDKPVIRKALVDLEGAPFKHFVENRDKWALETCYIYPGPIQFFGPEELVDKISYTLFFEQFGKE
jgi:pyrophosphate--fructose-6-phosphate 1-phosphotransferase